MSVNLEQLEKFKIYNISGRGLSWWPGIPDGDSDDSEDVDISYFANQHELQFCEDLDAIEASGNALRSLPRQITQLQNLEILNLSSNYLSSFPNELCRLSQLSILNISYNQMSLAVENLWGFSQLRSLNVAGNQFSFRSGDLRKLSSLVSLNLTATGLCQIPAAGFRVLPQKLDYLINLQSLHMGDNQIGIIPKSIFALKNLKLLSLESNCIREIPAAIGELVNLRILRLHDNELRALPPEINALSRLRELDICKNINFKNLPDMEGLVNLCRLNLTSTRVSTLEKVQDLHLEFLQISRTPICEIPPSLKNRVGLVIEGGSRDTYGESSRSSD